MDSEIIAVRAKFYMGWRLVFCFVFGVVIIIGGILTIAFMSEIITAGILFIIAGVFFVFTGFYYIYLYRTVPEVIAELLDGEIYFYPSKKRIVKIEPQNIQVIVPKHYIRSRFNTQRSGNLNILTATGEIKLFHVMDLTDTQEKLEKLRIETLFRLSKEKEAEKHRTE